MTFELDGFTIEIDEKVIHPGHKAIGMGGPWEYSCPAEGPEIEYIAARVTRNGRDKNISPRALIRCLERRLGEDWDDIRNKTYRF